MCIRDSNSEEDFLKMASDWQTTRGDNSIHTKAVRYCGEVDEDLNNLVTLTKLQRKNKLKVKKTKSMISTFSAKEHFQHFRLLTQPEIDEDASTQWLKSSTLKKSTESMICAIQEQAISTRYIQRKIHHTTDNDWCRLCRQAVETIHHLSLIHI